MYTRTRKLHSISFRVHFINFFYNKFVFWLIFATFAHNETNKK